MDPDRLRAILEQVAAGELSTARAMAALRHLPFEDVGFARVDHHRALRTGAPEVIYCPGKTVKQITAIAAMILKSGNNVMATRAGRPAFAAMKRRWRRTQYHEAARMVTVLRPGRPQPVGRVLVACAGTADIPVAEEARVTAEVLGARVVTAYDTGVAGLHRLLASVHEIQAANAIVVVAGMEGALASVVGGLAACPVIAVPTSVGYGASFAGVAPLLTMLNSCAPGVSVVNIDNGFGAGYIAATINRMAAANQRKGTMT